MRRGGLVIPLLPACSVIEVIQSSCLFIEGNVALKSLNPLCLFVLFTHTTSSFFQFHFSHLLFSPSPSSPFWPGQPRASLPPNAKHWPGGMCIISGGHRKVVTAHTGCGWQSRFSLPLCVILRSFKRKALRYLTIWNSNIVA